MTRRLVTIAAAALAASCASQPADPYALATVPQANTFCQDAQRVVTRTAVPTELQVHESFATFVKSKATLEATAGKESFLQLHQYSWRDAGGNTLAYSCKMKAADHLNIAFGPGSAGPDGYCHDMNEQVYALLRRESADAAFTAVVFDPSERIDSEAQRAMIGPVWLLPFTLTSVDAANNLHIATKGFTIAFDDPSYQRFPPSWRGTHYCHFIAPEYLERLLRGDAEPGVIVGRKPERLTVPDSVYE